MTRRTRNGKLLIAGREVSINAPGLKQIKRNDCVDLYWAKDEGPLFVDYKPATVRIHVDLSDQNSKQEIEVICRREQDAMLLWLEEGTRSDKERLKPKFNGTFGSLCDLYESDEESGYADLQGNTKLSYQDSLKIIRSDIGLRRIDLVAPKYFRTCYRAWKKPVQEGGEERVRRAYGAIGQIKILLGYGIEANHFPIHCERLLRAMSKMRFAKNPPRGITMTFEQAKSITREALESGDTSTAMVQALQYECFLRQIDIIGKWRVEPMSYVLRPGEIRRGKKVWRGMTVGMILNEDRLLRVRTSKTAQFVAHAIEKCELVMMCLAKLGAIDPDRPVVLQFKEAVNSVLEPYAGKSAYNHHGQRVVMGQRLMQPASDIFLGWATAPNGRAFYVRQLHDAKIKPLVETFNAEMLDVYAMACGSVLARAHSKASEISATIGGYLGSSNDEFDQGMGKFALAYADQAERDHAALKAAVRRGKVTVCHE